MEDIPRIGPSLCYGQNQNLIHPHASLSAGRETLVKEIAIVYALLKFINSHLNNEKWNIQPPKAISPHPQ